MASVNLKQLTPIKILSETPSHAATVEQEEHDDGPSTPGLTSSVSNISSVPSSAFSTVSRQPSWGLDDEGSIDVPRSMKVLRHRQYTNQLDIDDLLEQLQVSDLPAAQDAIESKAQIEVGKRIGQGTHANVYRGTLRGAPVAIKVANAKSSDAFIRREAAVLEYICTATESLEYICEHFYGKSVHGRATLFLELGESDLLDYLQSQTQSAARNEPILGMAAWLSTAKMLAAAIQSIHAIGVVHGDIKPQNFIMTSGTTKLIDFESAFTPNGPLDKSAKESAQDIMGSNVYAAPELLRMSNNPRQTFDTDIFALGVTLLVLATGREPYAHARTGIELIIQCQSGDPIRYSSEKARITPDVERIVRACCAKNASDRWSIERVVRELDNLPIV